MNSKNKLCAMFLASLLVVFTGIVIASSPVVDVGDGQIDTIGSTTTVNITLNEAQNGLSGYNLTVSLSNPSIAEIISVSYPSWATLHDNSTLPADSIWMKAADLLEQVESGATNINLGTLTFRGDTQGTTDIIVTVTKMDDDGGYPINPSTDLGHLKVGEAPEPELSFSPNEYYFGDMCEGETNSALFEIWNSGSGNLTYSLNESCGWVDIHPTSGSSTGEHETITVDIDTTGLSVGSHSCYISISSNGGSGTFTVTVNVVELLTSSFDTGSPANPYPSISGTHNGTISPNQTITVSKLYTYPCAGTGGHTNYVRIWNSSWDGAEAYWSGYKGDWHNISFDESFSRYANETYNSNPSRGGGGGGGGGFTLYANHTYNYTIRTGSYPQIHHTPALPTTNGWINCTEFIDANGRIYYDWIPAIKLF